MLTAARDRLARTLRGEAQTSVELTARTGALSLEVEGFGPVKFPATPAKASKPAGLDPARFGRGDETLIDPDVRDTWGIAKHLVRAEWDDAVLKNVVITVKDELGLPHAAGRTADLHSILVYEPNQFFLAHQDTEKDDSMVGTLVVTFLGDRSRAPFEWPLAKAHRQHVHPRIDARDPRDQTAVRPLHARPEQERSALRS